VASAGLDLQALAGVMRQAFSAGGVVRGGVAEAGHDGGADKAAALCAALLAYHVDLVEEDGLLLELFEHAISDGSAEARTAAGILLPIMCALSGGREGSGLLASQQQARSPRGGGRRRVAAHAQPLTSNPFVPMLQQCMEEGGMQGSLVQGLLLLEEHMNGDRQAQLTLMGVQLVQRWEYAMVGTAGITGDVDAAGLHASMPAGVAEWVRPALEVMCEHSADAEGDAGATLALAVAAFLMRAPPGQMERSRSLARWLLGAASSRAPAVRAVVMRRAAVLAEPAVIMALHHDGPHPIHTIDREQTAERHECEASWRCWQLGPCTLSPLVV
jgi:hypothetical protein